MTVTLNLEPETGAKLLARAQAKGVSLEQYLLSVLEEAAFRTMPEVTRPAKSAREEAVRRMREFGEKHHLSLGAPVTRRLLHEGHRF